MSTSNVLQIADYRDRRSHRRRLAESLYSASTTRSALLGHVADVAALTGADRAAVVWVDEYGPGLVHPHVVLDLLSDRPRRSFAVDMLRRAWELGVPSALDEPYTDGQSSLAVALGSDGTRAWFLVADSISVRPSLDSETRQRVMFLAGECSAVVLHRDLDVLLEQDATTDAQARFAGWPVLQDLEGAEHDDQERARISRRFVVARLARTLVEDDLTLPAERLAEQARKARAEIRAVDPDTDREAGLWFRLLDSFESMRMEELAATLVRLGQEAEASGHRHGALELYGCAYEIAAAIGDAVDAADAARFTGRLYRRLADWDNARLWYETARAIAREADIDDRHARVLAGLASMDSHRGNLPAARTGLMDALPLAARSGSSETLGSIYHELLTVEALSNNLVAAMEYGWLAVTTYVEPQSKIRGLASLAGALVDAGEYRAAEDAWAIVAHRSDDDYYTVYAWDALAYLAALRGDGDTFDRRASRCDALGWDEGHASAKAEILLYRGLSCQALGRLPAAEAWYQRAIDFCEASGFNQTLFKAEAALEAMRHETAAHAPTTAFPFEAPEEVRLGLREMRVELAAAAV